MFTNFYRRAGYLRYMIHHHIICQQRCFCTISSKKRNVILFPGQGSQFVGMTKNMINIPKIKQLFELANNVLGYNLMRICLCGPKDELDKTVYCQPAVFVASLAAFEVCKAQIGSTYGSKNMVTAGFSVGEFAALVLSKSLTFEDALRLVDIRAKAMQKASEEVPAGMVTVLGLSEEGIRKLLRSVEDFYDAKGYTITLHIASYLYPKGFVLAGHQEAIDYVLKFGVDKHGASKTFQLAVSGAFHTPLMKTSQVAVSRELEAINVRNPQIKVYSNVTGKPYNSGEEIKSLLPRHLVEPVKWQDIMTDIRERDFEQTFYELGPGRNLTAILAKINRRLLKICKNIDV